MEMNSFIGLFKWKWEGCEGPERLLKGRAAMPRTPPPRWVCRICEANPAATKFAFSTNYSLKRHTQSTHTVRFSTTLSLPQLQSGPPI